MVVAGSSDPKHIFNAVSGLIRSTGHKALNNLLDQNLLKTLALINCEVYNTALEEDDLYRLQVCENRYVQATPTPLESLIDTLWVITASVS